MKAPTTKIRFAEAQKLLDYGFSNYSYQQFGKKGDVLKSVDVYKGIDPSVNIVYEENSGALVKKGEDKNVEEVLSLDENIYAPVTKGQKMGEIQYVLNGETIGKTNLVAENDVKQIGIGSMIGKVFSIWFRVLR